MTEIQKIVWAATFSHHMDRACTAMDPRFTPEQREAYLTKASTLATEQANKICKIAPEEV